MKCRKCSQTVYIDPFEDKDYVFCLNCGSIFIGENNMERVTRMESLLTRPKDYVRKSRAKQKV